MTATNPDATTNKSTITIKGTFFNASFGAENNTVSIKVRWKEGSGAYNDWVAATATTNSNAVSATYEATLDYTKQWTIQASITDKLTTVLSKEVVIITLPVFDWSKSDFNFNVPITIQNAWYGLTTKSPNGSLSGVKMENTTTGGNMFVGYEGDGKVHGIYSYAQGVWLIHSDGTNCYICGDKVRKITSGTSAPSGGSDGDIYFQYT